jgi:glycosyltransferase involved in cell wall biosynthesis
MGVWSPRYTCLESVMTYSAAQAFDTRFLDATRFREFGAEYEAKEDLISAFGYYLVAAYLGYRIGDLTFSIRWMIEAISREADAAARKRRGVAIENLLKQLGITVNAARLGQVTLDLPPLIEPIPCIRDDHRRTCLIIADVSDVTENILVAIPEHSAYRTYVFRFGEMARMMPGFNLDRFLITLVRVLAPDLILFRHAGLSQRRFDPRVETLRIIRVQSDIPVIGLYCDIAKPSFAEFCHAYLPGLDGVVTLDSAFDTAAAARQGVLVENAWSPLPASAYFATDDDRPIDIGFVGRTAAHYSHRQHVMDALAKSGLHVEIRGADVGDRLTLEEMAAFLRSCKIVINFSATHVVSAWDMELTGEKKRAIHHVKGRVLEAIACGALLFESQNNETPRFFTPGAHYIEFHNIKDLKDKLAFYLANDELRHRIADAATAHYEAHYTGRHFCKRLETMVEEIGVRRTRASARRPRGGTDGQDRANPSG